jgi:hypothetical protein
VILGTSIVMSLGLLVTKRQVAKRSGNEFIS